MYGTMASLFWIALPSLLNCGCGLRPQSQATQNISSVNKAQMAYRTENTSFADNFDDLALGNLVGDNIDSESSKYYTYIITTTEDRALIQAIPKDIPKDIPEDSSSQEKNQYESGENLEVYIGGIFRYINSDDLAVTVEIICGAENVGEVIDPAEIVLKDGELQCPEGSERL